MRLHTSQTTLLFVASAYTLPTSPESEPLSWTPCNLTLPGPIGFYEEPPLPYQCANLSVPLDYTDESSESLTLNLIRVEALHKPAKGSILFNPGGPGGSGVEFVAFFSDDLHEVLGGDYNLIGWDPRGTGKTIPFFCESAGRNPSLLNTTKFRDTPEDELLSFDIISELPEGFEYSQEFSAACKDDMEATGSLLSTAFVARDMVKIIDALDGNDGLLNYWGISYGTYLGTTFASMFPERVGRVVLDSNVNPRDFRSGKLFTWLLDTDKGFKGFLEECINDPDRCPLARYAPKGDPTELVRFVNTLQPILDDEDAETNIFGSFVILKQFIVSILRDPSSWNYITTLFNDELVALGVPGASNSATPSPTSSSAPTNPSSTDDTVPTDLPQFVPPWNEGIHALYGIACSEMISRAKSSDELVPVIEAQQKLSQFVDVFYAGFPITCPTWQITAKEIYEGDFTATTANPVLLVNGIYDPVTPIASARNISTGLEESRVLEHRGYGHGVLSHPSLCTADHIKAYFDDGTLPDEGAFCEPDMEPFDLEFELAAALEGPARKRRSLNGDLTESDVKRLKSMRRIGSRLNDINQYS